MSFRRVVVALDLSPASRAAHDRARAIVDPEGSLVLLHVVDPAMEETAPRHATPETKSARRKDRERAAADALADLAREVRRAAPSLDVRVEVRSGETVNEILAAATDADLLAVGAHGKNVFDRLLLGSVAEEVARRSATPTLVVRAASAGGPRLERVLCAVDLGDHSRRAAQVAHVLARQLAAPLEAVHVVDARNLPLQVEGSLEPDLLDHETRQSLALAPRAVGAFLLDAGVGQPPIKVLVGVPGEAVARVALPTDVVVCGSLGRGALGRLVFGSVANYLLRHAPCPVVVVRSRG